jgi:undecaprenyl-diphosphatase
MSASVFKPFFERLRPCHSLDEVRLLVNCGGKYGFPSSHATNISGFAMLFSIIYSRYWYWFWLIAVLIGFSRIYVGVHYPGDVLFGYVIGILIAIVVYICYSFLTKKYPIIDYRVSLK